MKRGEVWTVADAGYASKPRPCVIVQGDNFAALESVTICLLTSNSQEASHFRIDVEPSEANGLRATSKMMADKLMTVPRVKLRQRMGVLESRYLIEFARSAIVFLGLERTG